jgi:hypothetical protein
MTEDEAKTKWCPFARGIIEHGGNRMAYGAGEPALPDEAQVEYGAEMADLFPCIGSACMAWRWRYEQTNKPPLGQASWPQVEPIYARTEQGFCGLAGGYQ